MKRVISLLRLDGRRGVWVTCLILLSLIILIAGHCVTCNESPAVNFYVAPNGNDAWSGCLPAPNAKRSDGPFATLTGARDAIRTLKAQGALTQPVRVLMRGGIYQLSEPLVFRPEDSGTADAPITYAAYPGEKPVLSSGVPITGWKKEGKLWTTEVPGVKEGRWYFRQLFVNGQRRPRARIPNEGTFRTAGPLPGIDPWRISGEGWSQPRETKIGFRYRNDDLQEWANLEDVMVFVYHSWTTSPHYIASLDPATRTVRFTAPSEWPMCYWETGERYYVENVREGLDAPGEWYLDRKTGVLTYYPLPDEDPTQAEVIAPALLELLRLEGDPENRRFVEYLNFVGLSFQHAAWSQGRYEKCDWQAAAFLKTAAIHARGARHCLLEQSEVTHIGGYAVWLERGCQENRIVQCHLHDLGAGGVRLGETVLPDQARLRAERNEVFNCFIHDGGHVYHAGMGVWIGRSSYNTVHHNEICDFFQTGISVGWKWSYDPSLAHDNIIEYNHIHHIGKGELSDMGGIYTLGVSPGTRIRYNLIHDVLPYIYTGCGIYPDAGSSEILIENNVVYLTKSGGFSQNYGRENTVRNNIFALAMGGQVMRSRQEPHISFTFERNIVYFTQGSLLSGKWGDGNFRLDHNLYWNASGEPILFPGDLTFAEWQKKGQDTHSLIADPLFVNPEHYDFRLKPNSPAFQLGFQPIDLSEVGLVGPPEWVNAPKQIHYPPVSIPPRPIDDGFEETPVGAPPAGASMIAEEKGASVRVTDEQAATGRHSLKFTDVPSSESDWRPQMSYLPNFTFTEGTVRLSFDLRLEPGAIAWMGWRDMPEWGAGRRGPKLEVDEAGRLKASDRLLMAVPLDEWFHVEIVCGLGLKATGFYDLTVTVPGQKPTIFPWLPCGHPKFRLLRRVVLVSQATQSTAFYLDNVKLETVEE